MAIAKYIFTVSNGQLLVELNNVAVEFEGEHSKTYKSPTLDLFKKNIKLFDFGIFVDSFKIENFDTIDGVVPTDIEDAFASLLALLPAGAGGGGAGDASSANQVAQTAVLNSILTELKDDVNASETVWYDKNTPTLFYVRRSSTNQDTGIITVSFYDVAGTSATPTIANLVQVVSGVDYEFNSVQRKATIAGTGYSINDKIQELQIINMALGTLVNTIWINKTTDAIISTPTFSNLIIDDTYASTALQTTGNASLSSIDTKTPALVGGKVPVSDPTALPLPSGASTSAKQDIGNASVASLDTKSSSQFVSSTGTLTGVSQTVSLALTDESAGTIQILGTWAGTITFEGTIDGTNFSPINAVSSSTSSPQTTTTVNGLYRLTPASFSAFRVNMTAFTSGTATISMRATKGVGGTFANQILPVKIDQTTNGTTNRVNIGTDGQVATNGTIFAFSTLNSTTAQLASTSTFTGTIESILNQQSYSILFFSDQNSTITIKQYIDVGGTKLISNLTYTYIAGSTNFARSGVANGNYIQVTVQNTGGSTTTTLQLDTAFGTIPSATPLNNSPSAINEINGTVISTGIGASDAGTQRHVLVNEQVQDLYFTGQSAQTATIQNIIPSTSSASATDVTGFSSGSIQIISTGTAGTFIFEGANDTPTSANYVTIPVWNSTIQTGTPITSAITASASAIIYVFPINYRYIRVRIATTITGGSIQAFSTIKRANFTGSALQIAQATAGNLNATIGGGTLPTVTTVGTVSTITNTGQLTPGVSATNLGKARNAVIGATDTGVGVLTLRNDALVAFGTNGSYNTPTTDKYGNILVKDQTRHKRTYSLAFTVAPVATATDIFQIIGSATTTVSINKINISGTQTTGGQTTVTIAKRSTANTGGTSTSSTMVVHDSTDASATSVGTIYTANPTTGTPVGNLRIFSLPLATATSTTNNIVQLDFGERGKPIILNGVAQALVIALGGVTLAGGSINVWIEFTEE